MHSRQPLLIALMALLLGGGAGHAAFRNTDNTRFATRANGPMGAIVIPHQSGVTNPAGTQGTLTYRQHNPNLLRRAAVTYSRIQDLNLTRHKGEVRFPRTLVHTLDGKLVQTDLAKRQSASYASSKSSRLRGRRSARSLFATGAAASTAAIGDLLAPGPAGRFAAYPIGRAVGSNRANGPGLLLPASRADLVGVVDPMTGEIIGGPDA